MFANRDDGDANDHWPPLPKHHPSDYLAAVDLEAHSADEPSPRSLITDYGPSPTTERVGWFRHYFASDAWVWSDEVYRIHGYVPGAVDITTAVVLSHKHPGDRERVAATLDAIRADLKPLSSRHRIVDTKGAEHSIVIVGDLLRDTKGAVIGTQGFYIDVSASDEHTQTQITERVAEVSQRREVIYQAKGMLMAIYGLDGDAAFDLLKWRSQSTQTKLHALAEQVVVEFKSLGRASELNSRQVYDHVVMTCHNRIGN